MTLQEKKIRAGRKVIFKYFLPESLKPEHDGKFAYEIVNEIIEAVENVELDAMEKKDEYDNHDCHASPEDGCVCGEKTK